MVERLTAWRDAGVQMSMPANECAVVRRIVEMLATQTSDRRGRHRTWLRRAFSDAYPTRAESEAFRSRHESTMRSRVFAATRRILASWPADGRFHLDQRGLDDWVITLANARWLYVVRAETDLPRRVERGDDDDANVVVWLQWAQNELIRAALPELDGNIPS